MTLNAKIGFLWIFLPFSPVRVCIIHKVTPRRWRHTRLADMCSMVPMGRVQMICDFRSYNYWSGIAIGFRASRELCSNFLLRYGDLLVLTYWLKIENFSTPPFLFSSFGSDNPIRIFRKALRIPILESFTKLRWRFRDLACNVSVQLQSMTDGRTDGGIDI